MRGCFGCVALHDPFVTTRFLALEGVQKIVMQTIERVILIADLVHDRIAALLDVEESGAELLDALARAIDKIGRVFCLDIPE